MEHFFDHAALMRWFLENKREFPWRNTKAPYAIWVSEVMLQQTRAAVVVPYFENWMRLFPSITALAQADFSLVLKAWEGLGYYSRARNLHAGAKQVVELWQGNLPDKREELEKIKGLGPYTIGAILAFGFGQKAACVDGNVKRVIARFFSLQEDISSSKTQKKIWQLAEKIQAESSSPISEALIELGALVCQKKAKCGSCPLKKGCGAFHQDLQDQIPVKLKKTQYTNLMRTVLVIACERHLLVRKCGAKEIMADLYEFPYLEDKLLPDAAKKWAQSNWQFPISFIKELSLVKHSFTRFRVDLFPLHFNAASKKNIPDYAWTSFSEVKKLAFSSGHRRILELLLKHLASG